MKMYTESQAFICATLLLATIFGTQASAQAIGSALGSRSFELGYSHRWFERKLEPDFLEGTDWGLDYLYLRYGATNWLTLSLEGAVTFWRYNGPKFPGRDYRDISFGAGITSRVWSANRTSILLILDYVERFSFDRSIQRRHKQTQNVMAGAVLEHRFRIAPLDVSVFASPVFIYDEYTEYPSVFTYTNKSIDNIGLSTGVGVVAYDHVRLFGQVVFASFWQPWIGAGYVF